MISCVSGDSMLGTWGISYGVPHRVDTEISPSYPKYLSMRILAETFSESDEKIAGM